jgi:hypothetical protein
MVGTVTRIGLLRTSEEKSDEGELTRTTRCIRNTMNPSSARFASSLTRFSRKN